MKRYQIFLSALLPLLDFILVVAAFMVAGSLRANHDLIPGLRLPAQIISSQDLIFFALLGATLLVFIESIRTGYISRVYFSLKRIGLNILSTAALWFVTIIAIIYLGNGYLYSVEIPRLVLLFAIILYVPMGLTVRLLLIYVVRTCMTLQYIERASAHSLPTLSPMYQQYYEQSLGYRVVLLPFLQLKENIRDRLPDILIIPAHTSPAEVLELQKIARIYGIRVELLQIDGSTAQYAHIDTDGDFPVLSIEYIRISTWGRLLKRVFDIIFGIIFLILFTPIMLVIALAIKWDDPSAPVIYQNKRTGKNGQLFTLYKFRYMQWQYSVKDAYGVDPAIDSALKFEHELRAGDKNSRTGPIYKITQGDPRHTRIGSLIERLSLDELPQLFNVLIGNMSLVGPRPHQPREVENYDEWHKQVLTVKPGITGMAQVFAREAADFDREAELDISYIENWSMPLDIWLLISTLRVLIIKRHG